MSRGPACAKLREVGAELALGVLPGRERAEAVAHLDRCAECREFVEQLCLVGDRLIGLLPDTEPPLGFTSRVVRSLAQQAAAPEERARAARGPGLALPGPRGPARRARGWLAVAAAVLAGFAGWAIGTRRPGAHRLTPARRRVRAREGRGHHLGRPRCRDRWDRRPRRSCRGCRDGRRSRRWNRQGHLPSQALGGDDRPRLRSLRPKRHAVTPVDSNTLSGARRRLPTAPSLPRLTAARQVPARGGMGPPPRPGSVTRAAPP